MGRTIAVANQKGGVGKTTTSVNLSAALATMRKSVLLVDLDPQGNATMGSGIDKYALEQTMYEVLIENAAVKSVMLKPLEDSAWVLPANADLTAAEVELMDKSAREQALINALKPVVDEFDYIIIDCPPSLNVLTLNAFVAADSVLIPIQCEYYALEGLSALLGTIEDIRAAVNPDLAIEGLLRTMFDSRNNLGNEVSAQLEHHFGEQVFRTLVPRNVRVAEAPSHGLSIVHYDKSSRGALAYLALAGELVRKHTQHVAVNNDQTTPSGVEIELTPEQAPAAAPSPATTTASSSIDPTQEPVIRVIDTNKKKSQADDVVDLDATMEMSTDMSDEIGQGPVAETSDPLGTT